MQGKTLNPQQIAGISQKMQGLKALNSLRNPEGLLQMMAAQNPMAKQVLALGREYGGDYDALTAMILQNHGYDPAAVQQQLAEAGII